MCCDEKVLQGSLVAWVFSLARMAASITRLVRHSFVRTQEEFQYSKCSFLLSPCERLAALSQYETHQQHAIIKNTLEEGQEKKHLSSPRLFNDKQQHSGTQ